MSRKAHLGSQTVPVRGTHHGAYEWTHHFDRPERHRLIHEDRQARNTVLMVLAGAVLAGLTVLVVTLVGFV